ncbi:MAG: copper chaperone PCu(A)C [Pseudomonadota bacterium]
MRMITLAVVAIFGASALPAWADPNLDITNVKAFATAPSAMAGGGFMSIANTGETDDRLVAVEANFPRVEIHAHEFDSEGVARMIHLEDGIVIPAGEIVTLEPGGLHVMFMGLRDTPLLEGETVEATLIFEKTGSVPVTFDIVKRDTAHSHNH